MQWPGGNADFHEGAILASACPGYHGNTGGEKYHPHTVPPVQHAGVVAVLEWIAQEYSILQEGGRAETMAFGDGGGKVSDLKGVQLLWAPHQDGAVLQIPGESTIGSR